MPGEQHVMCESAFKLLEPSRSVQASTSIALPFTSRRRRVVNFTVFLPGRNLIVFETDVSKEFCVFIFRVQHLVTNFHSRTVHLEIIKVLLPTDAQESCFKRNIKIYIKTAPTCFGVITIIRERTI
jgi:hypothetical protein